MVSVIRRMNRLRAKVNFSGPFSTLCVRHGPGAAILPANISRIHMEFAQKSEGGHMGPRKFWRENLPRLKFWNPAIPMIVNRTKEQQGAATMTLYFRTDDRASTAPDTPIPQLNSATDGSSPAPEPQPGEQTIVIDMKERHSSSILDEFLEKTGAVPVMPTPQENADLQAIEEMKKRSEIDREKKRVLREAQKREKAFLAEARSEAAALKNSAA